jgi:hypothetical protein
MKMKTMEEITYFVNSVLPMHVLCTIVNPTSSTFSMVEYQIFSHRIFFLGSLKKLKFKLDTKKRIFLAYPNATDSKG